MDCSIIICTRDRARVLQRTTATLAGLDYPTDRLEIVVVDNGSTDSTRDIVRSFAERSARPVTCLDEPVPGLSRARNRGVASARGEVVAFLDDDAFPERSDWIGNLLQAYSDPDVSAAGGDIRPIWPGGTRPDWIHDFFLSPLGLTELDLPSIAMRHYRYQLWGANLSFRKACVIRHGGFSLDLGRSGDQLLSGEETELCLRLEKEGKKIVYVPNAAVNHIISEERLRPAWLLERARAQGLTDAVVDGRHASLVRRAGMCLVHSGHLAAHSAGAALFGLLGPFRQQIFCQYKVASSRSYLGQVLGLRRARGELLDGHE